MKKLRLFLFCENRDQLNKEMHPGLNGRGYDMIYFVLHKN
jgi:hypothetical protein